jgi:hypothetical protein
MERRALMGGSLAAGLTSLMTPSAASALPADAAARAADQEGVSDSIDQLRRTVENQFTRIYTDKWQGVSRVRQQQNTWLRSTQKYPDFLEIGIDVWDNIYDWHVTHQQPLNMTRTTDGRYTMLFTFTTLLLRPEQAPDFVGFAFDADTRARTR